MCAKSEGAFVRTADCAVKRSWRGVLILYANPGFVRSQYDQYRRIFIYH